MKKLLIGAFAALALATSSLTLAQTYNSNGTQTTQGSYMSQSMKTDTQKPGVEKKVVKVEITGTKANGERIAPTEVTIDREVVVGKQVTLEPKHPLIIEVLKNRCENNNVREFLAGKGGKPRALHLIQVKVKDGKCESATLS